MRQDSLQIQKTLTVDHVDYQYHSLDVAYAKHLRGCNRLPISLKILLENLLRHADGSAAAGDMQTIAEGLADKQAGHEIAYRPARVLMQDFTGVPAVVDLAAMRDAMHDLGGDPQKINPHTPVDLVIDHSVQVDAFGSAQAFSQNQTKEMQRNAERYTFLRWGTQAFSQFKVVPPGTGICHQVNLEHLAKGVCTDKRDGKTWAYPDTVVGTDSHTTMVGALGILGWGVGGIEAEAAMLGQPISMLMPEVIGVHLKGQLQAGVTATDLVLTITQLLRKKGVVAKFVEFFGAGLDSLSLATRATIANMAPEYGATCGFFPIDTETLNYLRLTGRSAHHIRLVEAYAKTQGLWRQATQHPHFTAVVTLDLGTVEPCIAGPLRPQDRVALSHTRPALAKSLQQKQQSAASADTLGHGSVVIAAITSCTNTSNPDVLIAAALLAKKALARGLVPKPWVKTSLAPGSQVVMDYLKATGLQTYLDQLGFHLVGFGCTTCIGNSGPLPEAVQQKILQEDLSVCAVLSGNRNFAGRIHPFVKLNWLASPPLVVAFALAGTLNIDLYTEPLGYDTKAQPVFLKDIWPTASEIAQQTAKIAGKMFENAYQDLYRGDADWAQIPTQKGATYAWDPQSTYVQKPPYFSGMTQHISPPGTIEKARILAILGDSITTDHISPAGNIQADSPAGRYLRAHGVLPSSFNSYGARRGNHEVMMRGTFANIRIRNEMVPEKEGGWTRFFPGQKIMSIYDAAMAYLKAGTPSVVFAGKAYGTGSSRDWAAKGPRLLGVKAVIAESFERIHRSNLIGMGVIPLQFQTGATRKTLQLKGSEHITILHLDQISPKGFIQMQITDDTGDTTTHTLICRIDTQNELAYFKHGGILCYVLRNLLKHRG